MKLNFTSFKHLGEAIVYRSDSESRPGMFHWTFKLKEGGVVCTCEGWQYRGTCKHATNLPLDSPEAQRIQTKWRKEQTNEQLAVAKGRNASKERAEELEDQALSVEFLKDALDEIIDENLVIFFRKRFNDGQIYDYAAIRFLPIERWPNDERWMWATTGPKSSKYYTTDELVSWLVANNGVEEVWFAAEWEQIL